MGQTSKTNIEIDEAKVLEQELILQDEITAACYLLKYPDELLTDCETFKYYSQDTRTLLYEFKRIVEEGAEINTEVLERELMKHHTGVKFDLQVDIYTKLSGYKIQTPTTDKINYQRALENIKNYSIGKRVSEITDKARKTGQITSPQYIDDLRQVADEVENSGALISEQILQDDTDELQASFKEMQKGINTHIELKGGVGEGSYQFILPSGGVTVIGAPTGHGKSKMLQTLTLNALNEIAEDERVLYLTYEENKKNVAIQFINAYADEPLTKTTNNHGTLQTIREYLQTGKTNFMTEQHGGNIKNFENKCADYLHRINHKRIIIYKPQDNYLSTLLKVLNGLLHNPEAKIKAVFIDYVQELYIENQAKSKTTARTDELKEIMIQLDRVATKYDIPIITASQLTRETKSPLTLSNQSIADSEWISRKATEILLLWSSKDKSDNDGLLQGDNVLSDFPIGKPGKLYAVLTKSRNGGNGARTILEIHGGTGRVQVNSEPEQPKKNHDKKEDFILLDEDKAEELEPTTNNTDTNEEQQKQIENYETELF